MYENKKMDPVTIGIVIGIAVLALIFGAIVVPFCCGYGAGLNRVK